MTATTLNSGRPPAPLGPQWGVAAVVPVGAMFAWLWLSGTLERGVCAVCGGLFGLLGFGG
ncbi:MAG: hypothetical protein IPJ65_17970 [Archangiaceae bacterium]|nr:hypothetical protein [Archangiaceae bacterium]